MTRNIYNATKDYICEHCRKVIHSGEKYVDYTYSTKKGDGDISWHHYRYHCGCDNSGNNKETVEDKRALYERIQSKLDKEGSFLMADKDGIKLWVCGIFYEEDGPKYVVCRDWCNKKAYFVSMKTAATFHDSDGNRI